MDGRRQQSCSRELARAYRSPGSPRNPGAAPPDRGTAAAPELASTAWHLDPAHSRIEFHVPFYWGLGTVKGGFTRYAGVLDLRALPAIELTIDASSLETGNARRDRHLRSCDFFDVVRYPYVRFESDFARLGGDTLSVRGALAARGKRTEIELEARVLAVDAGYEIEAEVFIMHRGLGMTWNPLGISRPYSKLIVAGRLDPAPQADAEAPNVIAPVRLGTRGARGIGSEIARRSCRR